MYFSIEQAQEAMDIAVAEVGGGSYHGLVLATPRGNRLISMSLAGDVCGSKQAAGAIEQEYIKGRSGGTFTSILFGGGQGDNGAMRSRRNVLVVGSTYSDSTGTRPSDSTGTPSSNGIPQVVLFEGDAREVMDDMRSMARRFGGVVIMDHQSANPLYENIVADDGIYGRDTHRLRVSMWARKSEAIVQHGAVRGAVEAAVGAMRLSMCRVTDDMRRSILKVMQFHPDVADNTVMNLVSTSLKDVPLHMRIPNSQEDRDWLKESLGELMLRGIIIGAEDRQIALVCKDAIPEMTNAEMDADAWHAHIKSTEQALLSVAALLRQELTGYGFNSLPTARENTVIKMMAMR